MIHPPRVFARLLGLVLPADAAEGIAGDLEEGFHARTPVAGRFAAAWWYRRQVLSVLAGYAVDRTPALPQPFRKGTPMDAIRQDIAHAIRSLRTHPAYAFTTVLLLAIGIGANTAMFALIDGVLLAPLPFRDPHRLMLVHLVAPPRIASDASGFNVWSYPKYQVLERHQTVFEETALFGTMSWNITGTSTPERVFGEYAESTYFPVLGIAPQLGRTYSADETQDSSAPLAVISHRLWTSRFGADAAIAGRTIGLNGTPHTILGVMPAGFAGLTGQADVWVPVSTIPAQELGERWSHRFQVIARLAAGTSPPDARAAVEVLGRVIDEQHPGISGTERWGATANPLHDERVDAVVRKSMLLMLAAVGAVLLIVCINLAHLTLARALGRRQELSIRVALGASRLRVLRLLMTESVLVGVVGAAAGLLVASLLISAGGAMLPDLRLVLPPGRAAGLTRIGLGLVGLDARLIVFTVGAACLASLLFGLGPAWRISRSDVGGSMKTGATAGASGRFAARTLLTVAQVALAFVLLGSGGLLVKSLLRLQATELGFEARSLMTVRLSLPAPRYEPPRARQFFETLLERLSARPEVASVAFGNCAPVSGGCNSTHVEVAGRPPAPKGQEPPVGVFWASPQYFATLRIPVLRGRAFTAHDRTGRPKVVVVNQTAARTLWPGEDPIGKRIGVGQGGFWDGAEVIGIVGDVRYDAVAAPPGADVYLPLLQSPRSGGILFLRSQSSSDALMSAVRSEVAALDADLPLIDAKPMEERFGDATWRTRTSAVLLGSFAAFAVLLAALGVYGMVAQGVQQRAREIGVRLALGATPRQILRLVIGRVTATAIAGVVIGIALAFPATRLLAELLYQVNPADPLVTASLSAVLLAVAAFAAYVPARRASRIDPLITLRAE